MAIYRVVTPPSINEEAMHVVHLRYASSDGATRKFRRELAKAYEFKLDEVTYKEIDVKPGKAGLIAYLNGFHAQVPASYVAEGYPDAKKQRS